MKIKNPESYDDIEYNRLIDLVVDLEKSKTRIEDTIFHLDIILEDFNNPFDSVKDYNRDIEKVLIKKAIAHMTDILKSYEIDIEDIETRIDKMQIDFL